MRRPGRIVNTCAIIAGKTDTGRHDGIACYYYLHINSFLLNDFIVFVDWMFLGIKYHISGPL